MSVVVDPVQDALDEAVEQIRGDLKGKLGRLTKRELIDLLLRELVRPIVKNQLRDKEKTELAKHVDRIFPNGVPVFLVDEKLSNDEKLQYLRLWKDAMIALAPDSDRANKIAEACGATKVRLTEGEDIKTAKLARAALGKARDEATKKRRAKTQKNKAALEKAINDLLSNNESKKWTVSAQLDFLAARLPQYKRSVIQRTLSARKKVGPQSTTNS